MQTEQTGKDMYIDYNNRDDHLKKYINPQEAYSKGYPNKQELADDTKFLTFYAGFDASICVYGSI